MTNFDCMQVHSIEKIPMAYLPGGMQLVRVRVVGSLKGFSGPMHLASSSATPSTIPAQSARCLVFLMSDLPLKQDADNTCSPLQEDALRRQDDGT